MSDTDDAGASGDSDTSVGGEGETQVVESVTVETVEHRPDTAVYDVTIGYAAETMADGEGMRVDDGEKAVRLSYELTVDTENESRQAADTVDVYGSMLGLEAEGLVYDARTPGDAVSVTQPVRPSTTYTAGQYFAIPEDVTAATLRTDPGPCFDQPVRVTFEKQD